MRKLFSQESPLFQFLSFLADLMVLTVMWLISCIPVVTIGAANTALYSCVIKMRKGEGVKPILDFWTAFKSNFAQATALWGITVLLLGTVLADLYLVFFTDFEPGTVVKLLMLVLAFVMAMVISYIFPLQAYFINNVRNTLKNAVLLCVMYLPVSIVIAAINAIPFFVWLLFPDFLYRTSFLWLVLGGGVIAYVCSGMFCRIFQRHITQQP